MSKAVGTVTACVLWVALGDPANYHCGEAYRKAMGLNLMERSSGKYHGQLKITKRGPGIVRRWLYLGALRIVQDAEVKTWYQAKKLRDKGRAKGALVGVMRKLALALYATGARGETFDPRRLFPGKPLPKPAGEVATAVEV
jgi:transposase